MSVLEICRGLPGSGKTHYALGVLARWPRGAIARVSRDTIRGQVFHTRYEPESQDFEDSVTALQHEMIADLLRRDINVICDDTNLYDEHLKALVGVARAVAAGWAIRSEFTIVPLATCIHRDRMRPPGQRVGARTITDMFGKHLAEHYPGPLPNPEGV
jgi:tRNA uridine 5-carbamoylmethylation protein Kti12